MSLSITKPLQPLCRGTLLVAAGITPPRVVPPLEGFRSWAKIIQDTVSASCYVVQYNDDPSRAVEAASILKEVSGERVIVRLSADELCDIAGLDGVYLTPSHRTAATIEEALRTVRAKNPDAALVCNIEMPSKHLSRDAALARFMAMVHGGCTMGVISPWIDWNEANFFLEECRKVCNPLPSIAQAIYPKVTRDQWERVQSTGAVSKTIRDQFDGGNIEEASSAFAKSRLDEATKRGGAWIDFSSVDEIESAMNQLEIKQ